MKQGLGDYLLAGLCVCSNCGFHMHEDFIKARGYVNRYYRCNKKYRCNSKRIGAEKLESLVLDAVMNQILSEDYILSLVSQLEKSWGDADEIEYKLQQLKRQATDIKTRISRLTTAIEMSTGEISSLVTLLQTRQNELEEVSKEIETIKKLSAGSKIKISPMVINIAIEQMKTILNGDDVFMMQQILRSFVEKIDISQNLVKILYKFPLSGIYRVAGEPARNKSQTFCPRTPSYGGRIIAPISPYLHPLLYHKSNFIAQKISGGNFKVPPDIF